MFWEGSSKHLEGRRIAEKILESLGRKRRVECAHNTKFETKRDKGEIFPYLTWPNLIVFLSGV